MIQIGETVYALALSPSHSLVWANIDLAVLNLIGCPQFFILSCRSLRVWCDVVLSFLVLQSGISSLSVTSMNDVVWYNHLSWLGTQFIEALHILLITEVYTRCDQVYKNIAVAHSFALISLYNTVTMLIKYRWYWNLSRKVSNGDLSVD